MEGEELLKTGKLHLVSNATYICSVFCLIDKFQLYRKPKIKTVIVTYTAHFRFLQLDLNVTGCLSLQGYYIVYYWSVLCFSTLTKLYNQV